MDSETRAAITAMGDTILERMDRYFELQHAQHVEFRDEVRGEFVQVRGEIAELRDRVDALTARVAGVEGDVARLGQEVAQLRDYVTRELAGIRLELRELRAHPDQTYELRREIAELAARVDRLEQRQQD